MYTLLWKYDLGWSFALRSLRMQIRGKFPFVISHYFQTRQPVKRQSAKFTEKLMVTWSIQCLVRIIDRYGNVGCWSDHRERESLQQPLATSAADRLPWATHGTSGYLQSLICRFGGWVSVCEVSLWMAAVITVKWSRGKWVLYSGFNSGIEIVSWVHVYVA